MKKDLLERVRPEGNPLIDGETATFLWQGESAPQLIDDLHGSEDNRQMVMTLKQKGYNPAYRRTGGAHNYTTWRNSLGEALIEMFG
jgi:S-formylglutathione hydrolase FrmB